MIHVEAETFGKSFAESLYRAEQECKVFVLRISSPSNQRGIAIRWFELTPNK